MFDNNYPSYEGFNNNNQIYKMSQNSINIDEIINDNRLIIGKNDNKKDIYIPDRSRFFNTLVLGLKGTGKTTEVLPMFLKQDLKNKKVGATIIVTKNEMAYSIYTLAKQYKRKVKLLKPSINNEISNRLLWKTEHNYDYINEFIINYKEAIKRKEIVIIDMEILKYRTEGLRAVAMLLLQLQLDIQETDITQKTHHYLYIDDAQYYLPFIETLLGFSDNFNLGIILFLQSRKQLIKNNKDYTSIIDNNIRNILLLNSLTLEDVRFYSERFYDYKNLNNFYNRKANSFMFETLDFKNQRKSGQCEFQLMTQEDRLEMESKSKKTRVKLLKEKRKQREEQLLKIIKEKHIKEKDEKSLNEINEKEHDLQTDSFVDSNFNYDEIGEPKPFDLENLDETEDISIKEEQIIDIKSDNVKEIIFAEEKERKRKLASNIFNKINIDYCDDGFDFSFD